MANEHYPQGNRANQLAADLGVSASGIKKWLSGAADPGFRHLLKISEVCNVSLDWLAFGEGSKIRGASAKRTDSASEKDDIPEETIAGQDAQTPQPSRPIVGLAACGPEGWAEWNQNRFRAIVPPELRKDPHAFPILASGESMQPFGIYAGFLCWASPAEEPEMHDIICVERRSEQGDVLMSIKSLGLVSSDGVELYGYRPVAEDSYGGETQEVFSEFITSSALVRISVITHILTRPLVGVR